MPQVPVMLKKPTLVFGFLILATCLCHIDFAKADNVVRIFNVDVYLDREPQCTLGQKTPIKASVSPFQAQAGLGDIITELARKGAEAGGQLIYAIKLTSFVPYQGAIATAIASSCTSADFFPKSSQLVPLLDVMKAATSVRAYAFNVKPTDPTQSVAAAKPAQLRLKEDASLDQLRGLILSPENFDLTTGLRKSCPFIPSFGFEMSAKDNAVWWLISVSCNTAELVLPNTEWRRADALNLSPGAVARFRALLAPDSTKQ